jgi:hypothetical protein
MKWKKFLFGDINYKNRSADGNKEVEFKLKGGLIPNLVLLSLLIGLIAWIVVR